MAAPARPPEPSEAGVPIDEARRRFRGAEAAEAGPDRARYASELAAFLAYVESHRAELGPRAGDVAPWVDAAAMALYRLDRTEEAEHAADLGLLIAPRFAPLLHHKALILLARQHDIETAVPLLEQATEVDPQNKAIWGTLGEAFRLTGQGKEAAGAYLRAQQLDVTSTRYLDKALEVDPANPGALRMRLELAKAHGGDRPALQACERLLEITPEDPALLIARVELLAALGEVDDAIAAASAARRALPDDPHLALLVGHLEGTQGHPEAALQQYRVAAQASERLPALELGQLAEQAEALDGGLDLAIQVRQALRAREPRNLANLHALRRLAQKARRPDLGAAACQGILGVSPGNLEAMRGLAEFQLAAGRADEGFETYRALLRVHPHEAAEIRKAVEAVALAGRHDLVAEFSRAAVEADPSDVAAREALGRALARSGELEPALEVYTSLAEAQPDQLSFALERRQLLAQLGRTASQPEVLDQLFRLDPSRSDIAFERGEIYLGIARMKAAGSAERTEAARTAIVCFERASTDPARGDASLLGLARSCHLAGEDVRSRGAYHDYLARPGRDADAVAWEELGHLERAGGRWTEAEAAYDKALALGAERSELLWGQVEVLTALNREAKGLRLLDALLKREPDNAAYLRKKGLLMLKAGHRAEGVKLLSNAASLSQGDPQAEFDVASALATDGAYSDAVAAYQRGLAREPKSRPGRLALAETLSLAGRYNEAIPVVDQLLGEDPNDLAAWRVRADACRALGRSADLEYSLRAILLIDPAHTPALLEKYRLHLALGQKAEAYDCLAQFLGASGSGGHDPALLLEAGDLASQLGRPEEAGRAFERAGEADPRFVLPAALRRARLELGAGRPDQAVAQLEAALKRGPPAPDLAVAVDLVRGEALMALERAGEAEGVYRAALKLDPNSSEGVEGLGRSLLDQGKHADAKAALAEAIPRLPPSGELYLLLTEAESGLGNLPDAIAAALHGTEAIPRSVALWRRLGELYMAREAWAEAAGAFARAVAIEGTNPDLLLKAGFIAEKLGHPNDALSLYDRATQVAPSNPYSWSSQGVALLGAGRAEEAVASFDKALAIDPELDAAKQGRKAARDKARDGEIDRLGREALRFEAKLHRSVTKNDLFVTLHVPYDLLDPILAALSRDEKVDLGRLGEEEMRRLEADSCQIVTAALDRRAEGVERRGFTLADVCVLSPPTRSLPEIQRLFGYLRAVLEADLRPENLKLTPDVEDLARRALLLPPAQRTLFQLVRTMHVGLFKARLIKTVEAAGATVHTPLPSLDLGAYTPEFRATLPEPLMSHRGGPHAAAATEALVSPLPPEALSGGAERPTPRCLGCGGLASVIHTCGAPVCAHCIVEFKVCPKCHQPIELPPPPPPPRPEEAADSPQHAAGRSAPSHPAGGHPKPKVREHAEEPEEPGPKPKEKAEAASPEPPPRPPRPKEKPDDEPRL
jgi:tetratricopeptide (TPR) repeat protein